MIRGRQWLREKADWGVHLYIPCDDWPKIGEPQQCSSFFSGSLPAIARPTRRVVLGIALVSFQR